MKVGNCPDGRCRPCPGRIACLRLRCHRVVKFPTHRWATLCRPIVSPMSYAYPVMQSSEPSVPVKTVASVEGMDVDESWCTSQPLA
jgi:hypothetical protein